MSVDTKTRQTYAKAHEFTFAHPPGTPVLAWPGARDGEPLRTRTRGGAWVVPAGDVVVLVDGHPAGIAITHIEHDPTRQPAVPDVEFEMPPCPICGTSLDSDGDSLVCSPCDASWQSNGTSGSWNDPDARRCLATCRPLPNHDPDLIEQCILADLHDPDHRTPDGITTWTDSSAIAVTDDEGEAIG